MSSEENRKIKNIEYVEGDKMQKEWQEVYQKQNWGNKYPSDALVRFVAWEYQEIDLSGRKVLDAGCGNGTNLVFLAEKGFEVYGFDGSPDAVELAKCQLSERGYADAADRIKRMDLQEFDYPENFFDLTMDLGMISCLSEEEIKKALKYYYFSLKKGGILYCDALHEKNGAYGLDLAGFRSEYRIGKIKEGRLRGEYIHFFFTREYIERVFQEAGFQDIAINYFREDYANPKLRYSHFSVIAKK